MAAKVTVRLLFPPFFVFFCACGQNYSARRSAPDIYPDYAALNSANIEGRDFSREIYNRASPVSVFAIHGGDIELSTARLARKIAGSDFNLYIFNGWLGGESRKLHVTSIHFDDPSAVALSTSSLFALSVHAQAESGERVCVGGANAAAAREMASGLASAGFETEFPCGRLPGVNPKNIVNRPARGGVQLELTLRLLERLENSPADMAGFTGAARSSILAILKKLQN
jgi:phage replication-related protein YjqB (UPF0714/DUF867 family)